MKFIDSKAVQEMFGYSDTHIDRLVKAGKFPKPMKLTPGSKNLWTEDEMNALAADMLAQRDRDDASPKPRKIKRREVA